MEDATIRELITELRHVNALLGRLETALERGQPPRTSASTERACSHCGGIGWHRWGDCPGQPAIYTPRF